MRVVISDHMEQRIILRHGALRVSAAVFREELEQAKRQIMENRNPSVMSRSSKNRQ